MGETPKRVRLGRDAQATFRNVWPAGGYAHLSMALGDLQMYTLTRLGCVLVSAAMIALLSGCVPV